MADVRIGAKSTLTTLNKWIEVIASNITGANVFGYKGVKISFGDTLVDVLRGGTATSAIGGLNPLQTGTGGITINATSTDFSQGSIVQTRSNQDMAVQGNAFFSTVDASGSYNYTRNGNFHIDDAGFLLTNEGNFVMSLENSRPKDDNNVTDFVLVKLINYSTSTITAFLGMSLNRGAAGTGAQLGLATPSTGGFTGETLRNTFLTGGSGVPINAILPAGSSICLTTGAVSTASPPPVGNISADVAYVAVPASIMMLGGSGGQPGIVPGQVVKDLNNSSAGSVFTTTLSNKLFDYARTIADRQNNVFKQMNVRNAAAKIDDGTIPDIKVFIRPNSGVSADNLLERRAYYSGFEYHVTNVVGGAVKTIVMGGFVPDRGDNAHFDGTGQLVNDTRGVTNILNVKLTDPSDVTITADNPKFNAADTSPPFNYRIHTALVKFTNRDGLLKLRGSSIFAITDAAGQIQPGFAGMAKFDDGKILQPEFRGKTVGLENVIQAQALEASNTSITELLPELTVAQKTFTSNTKVVSVGNSIIDDMNGLIR